MTSDTTQWLLKEPPKEEIRYNDDGSAYIPIEFIKPKLDFLSPNWQTQGFSHFFYQMDIEDRGGNVYGKTMWVSGNAELVVTIDGHTRVLTGSATFDAAKYFPNKNFGQTCLSLCIVAAAKELGAAFGKNLNKDLLTTPTNHVPSIKDHKKIEKTLGNIIKIK